MRFANAFFFTGFVFGSGAVFAAGVTDALPADRPMPEYPAASTNLAGHVVLRFGIGADGRTRDIHITQSEPAGVFDQAALTAVKRWLYHPRLRNGRAVAQDDNAVNLSFKPPVAESIFRPTINYPRDAYAAHQEGTVLVGFDVTPLGATTNVHVLKSSPPGVFDKSALTAVSGWQYAETPGDKPLFGQTANISFTLAEAQLTPIPLRPIRLAYPLAAEQAGVMGNCNVGYWIEADGTTSDAQILSCTPSGYFETASLESVRRVRYRLEDEPRLNRRRYHCVAIKFRFDGTPRHALSYLKPGQWVKLRFTRSVTGRAKNIEVVGQSSPDVPTAKAIEQLGSTTLAVITENGQAVEKPNSLIIISANGD